MEQRLHVQFSGSLQIDDGADIVRRLRAAIDRRPKESGAFLRVREFGENDSDPIEDEPLGIGDGITLPIEVVRSCERK